MPENLRYTGVKETPSEPGCADWGSRGSLAKGSVGRESDLSFDFSGFLSSL